MAGICVAALAASTILGVTVDRLANEVGSEASVPGGEGGTPGGGEPGEGTPDGPADSGDDDDRRDDEEDEDCEDSRGDRGDRGDGRGEGRDGRGTGVACDGRSGDGGDPGGTASTPQATPPGLPDAPTPPTAPATGDGAAPHGSVGRNWAQDRLDDATHLLASQLANAADTIGYDNAARHMRHYLDNSGDELIVDPDEMMRDEPDFAARVSQTIEFDLRAQIDAQIAANWNGDPISFQVTTDWDIHSFPRNSDWFYAIGTGSYAVGAEVTVVAGPDGTPQVSVQHQTHFFDRYNWDGGKSVTIAGVTVTDEQLGHLHEVGIAQEYEVSGSGDVQTFEYEYTADGSSATTPINPGGN